MAVENEYLGAGVHTIAPSGPELADHFTAGTGLITISDSCCRVFDAGKRKDGGLGSPFGTELFAIGVDAPAFLLTVALLGTVGTSN